MGGRGYNNIQYNTVGGMACAVLHNIYYIAPCVNLGPALLILQWALCQLCRDMSTKDRSYLISLASVSVHMSLLILY